MKCVNCGLPVSRDQQACACGTKIDEGFLSFAALLERAEAGDARAQGEAAKVYLNGTRTVKEDLVKSQHLFQVAYDRGEALGYYGLGIFCLRGYANTPVDYEKALELARKAVDMNCVDGLRLMGHLYREDKWPGHNDVEALRWYRLAADQGDAVAQFYLGFMYTNGRGVTKSDAEAVKWYRLAADQGDAWAQCRLGVMYDEGRGVKQSDTEAVKWYRKAADQGDADAQYNLGNMYRDGRGVKQSDTEAVRWYQKSADQRNASAQCSLGWMYEYGRGVTKSDTEAARWYQKAAEQGNAVAQYYLGFMYERQGAYEEALAAWYHYHEAHPSEKRIKETADEWSLQIDPHYSGVMAPRIRNAGQRFLFYTPCRIIFNYTVRQTISAGYSHDTITGASGSGYFILTDQSVYVCALAFAPRSMCYHTSLLLDAFTRIKEDTVQQYLYANIRDVSMEPSNKVIISGIGQVVIGPYSDDDMQLLLAAINMGRSGAFARLKAEESSKPAEAAPAKPAEDPMELLKKLKQLLDAGVLSQAEYDQRKAKLLQEMGL